MSIQRTVLPLCDHCAVEDHAGCEVLALELVADRETFERQYVPCSCRCGGGAEAWRA